MHDPKQQPLAFRPPVHRKHERSHHGKKSPKAAQRKSVRAYADIALHVMGGSETDMTSLRSSISPNSSLTQAQSRTTRDKHSATGNTSAESSLSRETVSQTSSMRSRNENQGSSLHKKHAKVDSPFAMEGEIHESSLYEPPKSTEFPKNKRRSRKEGQEGIIEEGFQIQNQPSNEKLQPNLVMLETEARSKDYKIIDATKHEGVELRTRNQDVEIGVSRERHIPTSNCVTLTGTIKRGKKQDLVNVNLTPDEIAVLQKATSREKKQSENKRKWGCSSGPHVFILSLLYIPLAFISSLFLSFYTGSMCWYNIYIHLSEERGMAHKIFLCPLLIISYPLYIVMTSFCIAFYAMFVQVSWYCSSWQREIKNLDKNFYGWLCNQIGLPQCAPYEIIILDDDARNIETTESLNGGAAD